MYIHLPVYSTVDAWSVNTHIKGKEAELTLLKTNEYSIEIQKNSLMA